MARSHHAYMEDSTHCSSGLSCAHKAQTYRAHSGISRGVPQLVVQISSGHKCLIREKLMMSSYFQLITSATRRAFERGPGYENISGHSCFVFLQRLKIKRQSFQPSDVMLAFLLLWAISLSSFSTKSPVHFRGTKGKYCSPLRFIKESSDTHFWFPFGLIPI